jgi:integrase
VARWVTAVTGKGNRPSNNLIRQRLSHLRCFLAWMSRTGRPVPDIADLDEYIQREYPRVYGKLQGGPYPARFLTYDEAFRQLVPACQDGTWIGSRDQLIIRMGLLGLRRQEIVSMTWQNWQYGEICLTGKRNRVRRVNPGPRLTELMSRWQAKYERELWRPLLLTDPVICGGITRRYELQVNWGTAICTSSLHEVVVKRGQLAGLGHISPHDLRRSAASILHKAKTADGGHLYDLRDIQQVLDHANPSTTQRSYLDVMDDTVTKTRAGLTLD